MNESQTQFDLIEPALKAAGWGEVPETKIRKEFPISAGRLLGHGRRAQPLKADYVLEYKNRRVAVVEAKARDEHYTKGVAQAKDYTERLNIRHTYSTNGQKIYGIDMQTAKEGDISNFPTPDQLWNELFPPAINLLEQDKKDWAIKLQEVPFEDRSGTWQPRYYQHNAITATLDSIAEGKDRILLTLATGTGKTAIAFQIAWKLFHSRWNIRRDGTRQPRILFLADRNILADQAFNAFSAFEDDALVRIDPASVRKHGKVPTNGSIFFTIFQTFMSGPNDSPNFGEYPKDFFDLIIIDECHRGGANDESTWRAILEYFSPAVQIGLTATPKRVVNADTYDYFGKPVYTYSLKDGINDGFLTPFKMAQISTTVDEYVYDGSDDIEGDEKPEIGTVFTIEQQNRIVKIMAAEEYRVKKFMGMINQSQKTLVFCATQEHALAVRDLINQNNNSGNPNYCQRVTADDGKLGERYLAEFQDNEKTIPTILTTSQKLSTGVDAPEVRNIVLMRPVKSMVEFKQIVGRGTRLFDGKDYFTIYDFVGAYKHFADPEWDGEPLDPEPAPEPRAKKACQDCGQMPCICPKPDPEPCEICGNIPCVCDEPPKKMITILMSDGNERQIDSMVKTSFWNPNGSPLSAEDFIKKMFGDLPELFSSEDELRRIWSLPGTRRELLNQLADKGYAEDQLADLSQLIHAEQSDLFDVLSWVAYSSDLIPRIDRAKQAANHTTDLNQEQSEFIAFVLGQYVKYGVAELDDAKLDKLLHLKYNSTSEAKEKLGAIQGIRQLFIGFQKNLYSEYS